MTTPQVEILFIIHWRNRMGNGSGVVTAKRSRVEALNLMTMLEQFGDPSMQFLLFELPCVLGDTPLAQVVVAVDPGDGRGEATAACAMVKQPCGCLCVVGLQTFDDVVVRGSLLGPV